jgi:hypothetical protein
MDENLRIIIDTKTKHKMNKGRGKKKGYKKKGPKSWQMKNPPQREKISLNTEF